MPLLDSWRGDKKPRDVKAFMGWAGVSIKDESVDVLDMLRAYIQAAAGESCGQCFPCREGLKKISGILNRLCEGFGQTGDEKELCSLAELVRGSSRCDIGQTTPQPLLDILNEIKGESVELSFSDGNSPSVIHDTSDASAIYVLMPMRV